MKKRKSGKESLIQHKTWMSETVTRGLFTSVVPSGSVSVTCGERLVCTCVITTCSDNTRYRHHYLQLLTSFLAFHMKDRRKIVIIHSILLNTEATRVSSLVIVFQDIVHIITGYPTPSVRSFGRKTYQVPKGIY